MTARPVVLLLHGPNLNLLGDREPEIYGTTTLQDHVDRVRTLCDDAGLDLEDLQSNSEHELVDAVHGARRRAAAIIINAGALTHYGWSLHDALATYDGVVIELTEHVEDRIELIGGHAHAGVDHLNLDNASRFLLLLSSADHLNLSAVCELDGVA